SPQGSRRLRDAAKREMAARSAGLWRVSAEPPRCPPEFPLRAIPPTWPAPTRNDLGIASRARAGLRDRRPPVREIRLAPVGGHINRHVECRQRTFPRKLASQ